MNFQDNAADLVSDFIMSASSATLTESTSEMAMKPLNTENSTMNKRRDSRDNNNKVDAVDDAENLNPEDVHKSLRSTANAIQNYSFEAKSDDIPSLAEKMSLMNLGMTGDNSKNPVSGNGNTENIRKYRTYQ